MFVRNLITSTQAELLFQSLISQTMMPIINISALIYIQSSAPESHTRTSSIPAGGPIIVEEFFPICFFSTVPGLNFDTCSILTRD